LAILSRRVAEVKMDRYRLRTGPIGGFTHKSVYLGVLAEEKRACNEPPHPAV